MKVGSILGFLSALFAFAAAVFWGWSTMIKVPVLESGYGSLVTVMKDGSTVGGVKPFYEALAQISRLNAWAAGCAGLSAVSQAVTLLLRK